MERLDDAVAWLDELVSMPTVSIDSNLDLIARVAERLEGAGARVRLQESAGGTKANLFATLGPDAPGGIVLSGHSDVVPVEGQEWSSDPFALRSEGGRLHGRGTCDMKGFIAAVMARLPDFAALDIARPLHVAITYDEETGCLGARDLVAWLRQEGLAPALAILGEPTSMKVIDGHKGCCEYTTRFTGLAGHGSAPDRGVNAVEYAARYVAKLLELSDRLKKRAPADSPFDPPWSTLSTGAIQGGHAHNVIPEQAAVAWELRPVRPDDLDFVKAEVEAYARDVLLPAMLAVTETATITTEVIGEVAGLTPATVNEARDIAIALTGANGTEVVSFGTEGGLFQSLGMDVVVCGPGSIAQAHQADEYLEISELSRCLDMLGGLRAHLTA